MPNDIERVPDLNPLSPLSPRMSLVHTYNTHSHTNIKSCAHFPPPTWAQHWQYSFFADILSVACFITILIFCEQKQSNCYCVTSALNSFCSTCFKNNCQKSCNPEKHSRKLSRPPTFMFTKNISRNFNF